MRVCKPTRVLILENQLIVAADISLQLTKLGYHVIGICSNSDDTIKNVLVHCPDLLLMNIGLKNKTRRMKEAMVISNTFKTPVVIMSAHSSKEMFRLLLDNQLYAFIPKPFKTKDLQKALKYTLMKEKPLHNKFTFNDPGFKLVI